MMRAWLLRCGRWLIALAILFFLIKHLYNSLAALEVEAIALQPLWLIASLTLLFLYFGVLGMPWFFLYQLGNEKAISFVSGWTFFQLSQLGRYLPGKVGQFVWMLSLSRKFTINKKRAVLATCFQLGFQCCVGCIIGSPLFWSKEVSPLLPNLLESSEMISIPMLLVGSLSVLTLGVCAVFLYRRCTGKMLSSQIKQIFREVLSVSGSLLLGGYFLLWGLLGIAFFLLIKSLYPIPVSQLFVVINIYAIAWSIGFLSFITPSGLGIREGVLSLLLTSVLPPAAATLVALLSRLWTLGTELTVTGVVFGLYWRQKTKGI